MHLKLLCMHINSIYEKKYIDGQPLSPYSPLSHIWLYKTETFMMVS